MSEQRAILTGGCFWGMQDLIRRYDGVTSTRVGYTGADVPNATYAITAPMPKRSRSSSIRSASAFASCPNSCSRSTTRRH